MAPPDSLAAIEPDVLKAIEDKAERDTAAAERELRAFLQVHPDSFEGQCLLGWICFRRSGFEDMEAAYERAAAIDPRAAKPCSFKGIARFYRGDLLAAREAFTSALAIQESFLDLTRLGCCLHRCGEIEAAIEVFERALKALRGRGRRHSTYVNFWLMRALREAGRLQAADEAARQILRFIGAMPVSGSSTLVVHLNQMDFWEWDRFRKKEGLHAAIADYRRSHGRDAFPFYPASFSMPEEREAFTAAAADAGDDAVWIVKPTFLFGGQGMKLVRSLAEIPDAPGHIVQSYIADPYLIQGKKSHIRLYLLIASADPLRVYLWQNGIVRIAPEAYRPGLGWLDRSAIHITNTALHRDHPDLVLSKDRSRDDLGNIWSLEALLRHIAARGGLVEVLWQRLQDLALGLTLVIKHGGLFQRQAAQQGSEAYPPKLIGMDVLLDSELRPWLLEVQRTPGQTGAAVVEVVNAELFQTIAAMSAFPLLSGEDGEASAQALAGEIGARRLLEAEGEFARRGGFLRLLPPGPPAKRRVTRPSARVRRR